MGRWKGLNDVECRCARSYLTIKHGDCVDGAKTRTDPPVPAATGSGVFLRGLQRLGTEWSVPVFAMCTGRERKRSVGWDGAKNGTDPGFRDLCWYH